MATLDTEEVNQGKSRRGRLTLKISYRQVLGIALPLMVGHVFHSIITLTDMVFIGRVGEAELAACGIAGLFYVVIAMIGVSFSQGAQILIARRAGENDPEAIGRLVDNLLYLTLGISVILFLFVKFGSVWLLDLLFASETVYELSIDYLNYRAWGIPFVYLLFGLGGFYSGIGRTMVFVYSASIMAVVNVFLNYSLIFGHFGFPQLGLEGAAIASMSSEVFAFAIALGFTFVMNHPKHFSFFKFRRPDRKSAKEIVRISGPIILQSSTGAAAWFAFFTMIERSLGERALAASNLLRIIYIFCSIPVRALGGAVNTLVSNVIGQRKLRLVSAVAKKVMLLSLAITGTLVGVLLLLQNVILENLAKGSPELIEMTRPVLWVVGGGLLVMAVSVTLFRSVTGTGAVTRALRMEVVSVVVYLTYIVLTLYVFNVGLAFAWTAEIVYWIMLAVLGYSYLRSNKWTRLKV